MSESHRHYRSTDTVRRLPAGAWILITGLLLAFASAFPSPLAAGDATASIGVMVEHNWIELQEFPIGTNVTVSVAGGLKGTQQVTTDGNGYAFINWWEKGGENRPRAGDEITASYDAGGPVTITMLVQDVRATADVAGDDVVGTAFAPGGGAALAGRTVDVSINQNWDGSQPLASSSATVDPEGRFTVDFTPLDFDLQRGHKIFLTLWEDTAGPHTGNRTMREVYNGAPALGTWAAYNWLQGNGFPFETPVTVSVTRDGAPKGTTEVVTDPSGSFWCNWWPQGDDNRLLPGDTVTATYGQTAVAMLVQDLRASVDLESDTVSGLVRDGATGDLLTAGRVSAHIIERPDQQEPHAWLDVEVSNGAFALNFSGTWDIVRGNPVGVIYTSPEGHQTMGSAYNEFPTLGAALEGNSIQGNHFPPETTLAVSVTGSAGGAKGTAETATDLGGSFWLDWWPQGDENRIVPGDLITVTYGQETVSMRIQSIAASVDLSTDVVSGSVRDGATNALLTAGAVGAYIATSQYQQEPSAWLETPVAGGAFTLDFHGTFDIVRGNPVSVTYTSPEGHQTTRNVYNEIPAIRAMVDHNWLEGEGFPPGASVDVTVSAGATLRGTEQTTADPAGRWSVWWWSRGEESRLRIGDVVTATFGDETAEMTIRNVQAVADTGNDRVTGTALDSEGTALAGRKVQVSISAPGDWGQELKSAESLVGADGTFAVELASFDLVRGQGIWLTLFDASDGSPSGHQTIREVYNGIPFLQAMIDHNWVGGGNLPPSTEVTVSVNAGGKGTTQATTDGGGWLWVNWNPQGGTNRLAPGDTLAVDYGLGTAEMLVQDVQATTDVATDSVSGMALDAQTREALGGDSVSAKVSTAWNQQEPFATRVTTVGQDGSFALDFSGAWDILRGNAVFLTYTSPEGHQTIREPSVPDITGRVTASDTGLGMPGVEVTLFRDPDSDEMSVQTDGNGVYTIANAHVGPYKLRFNAAWHNGQHDTNYQTQWHQGKDDFGAADWVGVTPNGGLQIINAVLEDVGGGISGQVTGDGASGLAGVWACAQSASWTSPAPNCAAVAATGDGGGYSLNGLKAGDYKVLFWPGDYNEQNGANYALKWYASTVTVVSGAFVRGIDAQLEQGGKISGQVTGSGGAPLANVDAAAVDASGVWAGNAETDDAGNYTISGLPPGNYTVHFDPRDSNGEFNTDYLAAWYQLPGSTSHAEVTVVVGETMTGIGAQLVTGGRISGTVRGTGGSALAGVQVQMYSAADGNTVVAEALSSFSGSYLKRGVPPGDYKLVFDPTMHNQIAGTDYLPEWYDNKAGFTTATAVAVVKDATATADAQLVRAATNTAPTLTVICDRTSVTEGVTLRCNLTATDSDDDVLTFSATGLPAGCTFTAATGAFSWTPNYRQSGRHTVQFTVTDSGFDHRSDSETVTFTVADHNPVLFYDRFTDGSRLGDPEWVRKSGAWSVDSLKRYFAGSLTALNLTVVKKIVPTVNPVKAGRIEAKVMLTTKSALAGPDAKLLFAYLGTTKYRYVQLSRGLVTIGQVGSFSGIPNGWKRSKAVKTVQPNVWLTPRVDLYANGQVRVYLRGVLVFYTKFPTAVGGGVGLATLKAQSLFDDYKVSDGTIY